MEAASSPAPNQAKPVLYKSGVAGGNWGSKEKGPSLAPPHEHS